MKRLPIWEIMDRMQAYGRTFYDEAGRRPVFKLYLRRL